MKTKTCLLILVLSVVKIATAQTLIAEYNFTGGTGSDNSGNGNNGTVYGSSTTGNTLVIGSNTSDYFVMPASVINNKLPFGVSFKIKFSDFNQSGNFSTNHIIAGDNSSMEGSFALSYQKSVNLWRFALNGALYDFLDNSIVIDRWYCVTLVRNTSSVIKLYINNVQHPTTYINRAFTSVITLLIGQETDCTGSCFDVNQCANAMIDDFKFYSDALQPALITANCKQAHEPVGPVNIMENTNNQGLAAAVYPNPVTDFLSVEISSACKFELVNELGQIKLTGLLSSGFNAINVETLAPGFYTMVLLAENSHSTYKIVKSN